MGVGVEIVSVETFGSMVCVRVASLIRCWISHRCSSYVSFSLL